MVRDIEAPAVVTRAASELVPLAGGNDPEHTRSALDLQTGPVHRRFRLTPPTARAVAGHAFEGGRQA